MTTQQPTPTPASPPERRGKPAFLDIDFNVSPFISIWEITRACALRCVHCRAEAIPNRNPNELTWEQGTKLIDDIRSFSDDAPPLLVFTGGDPIMHPDIYRYIEYADKAGLRVALTPSATPLLTQANIHKAKQAGLTRMAISLDGSTAEIHDNFRKQAGSFDLTIRGLKAAIEEGLTIQVNTTISKWNINDIDPLCDLMRSFGLTLWAVFFLVPTGRGEAADIATPEQFEQVFNKLFELQMAGEFDIKTTAAPHYRRVVMQRMADRAPVDEAPTAAAYHDQWRQRKVLPGAWARPDTIGRAGRGVNDANGFVFIDHVGNVHPSGFMPYPAGNVKTQSIVDIYRNSEIFTRLRDFKQLSGKCRMCEFRDVCGGARSRSFGYTGDPMASEPFCTHIPEKLRGETGIDWLSPEMLLADMTPFIEKYGDV